MNKTILLALSVTFLTSFLFFPAEPAFSQSQDSPSAHGVEDYYAKLENAKSIAEKAKRYALGHPFDDPVKLVGSWDLALVAEKITTLQEGNAQDAELLRSIIRDIQLSCRNRNTVNPHAIKNFYAMADEVSDLPVDLLLASFVLVNKTKRIDAIETLLEFSKVHLGKLEEAETAFIVNTPTFAEPLTEEQKLDYWPAAKAIISNPEQSVPLLIGALMNEKLDTHLRLQAAAFLKELAPDVLGKVLPEVETDVASQVQCIQAGNVNWKFVLPDTCGNLEKVKSKAELLKANKQ